MRTFFNLAVAITVVLAAPILRADLMETDIPPVHTLTLTENSSTSLTYTYDGTGGNTAFTIAPNGTDNWTVSIISALYSTTNFYFTDFTADFTEPLPEVNEVNEAYAGGNVSAHQSFTVESDEPIAVYTGGITTTYPNGGTTTTPIGFDGGTPIYLRFIDNATASETASGVTDSGSSMTLLALSVGGLAAITRFRRIRLA